MPTAGIPMHVGSGTNTSNSSQVPRGRMATGLRPSYRSTIYKPTRCASSTVLSEPAPVRVSSREGPAGPFKANAAGRHHFPRQRHRVTNWSDYDAALRQRGSLTVWFTDEAVEAWRAEPRTTRGGQPRYSALAIATALTLRAVFGLPTA
jgi:hypothetical protein